MSHKIVRWFIILVLCVGLSIVSRPQTALAAGPWYVVSTGDDGNDCLSPASACATINAAIGKASGGDTVYVAEGTYTGTGPEVVLIDRDVTIAGGWNADFSAQAGTSITDGQGVRRGVTVQSGVTASIQRFTLQNGNVAGGGGGVNNAGTLSIGESAITGNVAGSGSGSAIYNTSTGVLNLSHSSIRHNGSDQICWVVVNEGTLNADYTVIDENTSTFRFCFNITIISFSGVMHFSNSSVSNNQVGGGIYNYATLIVENSAVNSNEGIGLYNWGGNLTVNNSTVSSNGSGGMFAGGGGQVRLNNATLTNNSSGGAGGGINTDLGFPADISLQNSILAGNTAASAPNCFGSVGSSGYNIIGDNSGCNFTASTGDLINVDPQVGLLIGSPSYHPLLSTSPAINGGNPAGCADQDGDPLETDQRGVSRTGVCDIGAYEYTTPGPVSNLSIIGGNAQSILVNQPFSSPLQVAALDSLGSPVDGVIIDFTAPDNGPSGTFGDTGVNSTSATSNESGLATAAAFTANDQAGTYVVSASTVDVGPVDFHLENIGLPPNDNFSDAQIIGSLPFLTAADNTNASTEPGEPVGCGTLFRSLWYSFTPSETIPLRVTMSLGQISGTLSIFRATGPSIADLNFVTCLSTGGSTNLQMIAGETYYLRLDSFGGPGILEFSLEQLSPPANDSFANAEPITSFPFSASPDNTEATIEPGEPGGCGANVGSLWYSITPSQTMALRLSLPPGGVLGAVSVFYATGNTISDLTFLTCATTGGSNNFQVSAGQTYYLRVDSYVGNVGSIPFNVEPLNPPANDNFANAEVINVLPFSATVENTDTTIELGEPSGCGMNGSVWYSFTPAENIAVRANMIGGATPGLVNIYRSSGPGISNLIHLGCAFSENSNNFNFAAGVIYYLQVTSNGPPGVLQLNLQQITPPTNDNFADAEEIDTLPFNATVNNTDATTEPDEPSSCNFPFRSVWYSFTPAETMALQVGTTSAVGSSVGVFRAAGSGLSDLAFVTCAFNGSTTNFRAEAGETYYLRVDSSFQTGLLEINMTEIFPPANDDFAGAQAINSLPFTVIADNTNASAELGEPIGCSMFAFRSLWYSFTPSEDMSLRVSAQGSVVFGNVSVFHAAGPAISDLNFIACGGNFSTAFFEAQAGETYYLRLDSFGQAGNLQLSLAQRNPPPNDNFANAQSIDSVPFNDSVDITDAATEPNELLFCYSMSNTVWYSFMPTETMLLRANTFGSSISGNVNVYRSIGPGFSDLQFVTCSGPNSSPSFVAEAGQTYYLQVGQISFESGTVQVNLVPTNPPLNDNLADAEAVTTLPFNATVEITDATNEPAEPQICIFMPTTAWYAFTPAETIKVQADTQGSTIDANVNVYHATGDGFSGLENLGCSIFSGGATSFLAQAGETYYFQVGGSGQPGMVQLNLAEMPTISGRVTDAVTGAPLPGNAPPYASVRLERSCGPGCFEFFNSQSADSEGHFVFDSYYYNGSALPAGSYRLEISANQYLTTQFGPFEFNGTSLDVGDVPVSPPSIIRGRTVDANSGNPVDGVLVTVNRCFSEGCFLFVNSQYTDENGQFYFNTYHYGSPLNGGTYELLFADNLHQPSRIEIEIGPGEDRNLGDVALAPIPVIGSIRGRLVDQVTGQPVSQAFNPSLVIYRCNAEGCFQFVNSLVPDSSGRFQLTTDYLGNPIPVGTFRVLAFADQYQEYEGEMFIVGEGQNKNVGDIRMTSFPVRFSDIQACNEIPAEGGDCVYSVKITNGQPTPLAGRAWSQVNSSLPDSFIPYTEFEARTSQGLDLAPGQSQTLQFRFHVPANRSPYGSDICTALFVGQGNNPTFNTIGNFGLFCILRNASGSTIASAMDASTSAIIASSTGSELEPNNSCQTAQGIDAADYPFVLSGDLDGSQFPDIDFYRFTATPGERIAIDHEGQSTAKGTLGDPLLGYFDSNCNLITYNDDSGSLNSHLDIVVPADGIFIMAATAYPDFGFVGGGNGSYQLTVTPVAHIGSINGVVTDAATGNPLRGDAAPFATAYLLHCTGFCQAVNSQAAGADGAFSFSTDFNGALLPAGSYLVIAEAAQYQTHASEIFAVGEGENLNLGNIPLTSNPVRFGNTQVCSLPSEGGVCEFNVTVTNALSTRLSGQAWSMVRGYGIGSSINFTNFQSDTAQTVTLDPGRSRVLRFRFRVSGSVADGALICPAVFVGQNPDALFHTVGQSELFCFVKGQNGFTLMSEQDMHQQLQHMRMQDAEPRNVPSIRK